MGGAALHPHCARADDRPNLSAIHRSPSRSDWSGRSASAERRLSTAPAEPYPMRHLQQSAPITSSAELDPGKRKNLPTVIILGIFLRYWKRDLPFPGLVDSPMLPMILRPEATSASGPDALLPR